MSHDPSGRMYEEVLRSTRPDEQVAEMEDLNREITEIKAELDEHSVEILHGSMELLALVVQIRRQMEMLKMLSSSTENGHAE